MQKRLFILLIILFPAFLKVHPVHIWPVTSQNLIEPLQTDSTLRSISKEDQKMIKSLGMRVSSLYSSGLAADLAILGDSLNRMLFTYSGKTPVLAEIFYYMGTCYLLAGNPDRSLENLTKCADIKGSLGIVDEHYANALFNAALAYYDLGDHFREFSLLKEYLAVVLKLYGPDSPEAADACSALIGASVSCNDYEGFVDFSLRALGIISRNNSALSSIRLRELYGSIGAGYAKMGDYSKAIIYLEKTELITREEGIPPDANYINNINNLTVSYGQLGLTVKVEEFYERGVDLAIANPSEMSFNLINTFAIELGRKGETERGAKLLSEVVRKSKEVYGSKSRLYIESLNNYAGYLVNFTGETEKALYLFRILIEYQELHENDLVLKNSILKNYARFLGNTGEWHKSLAVIRSILSGEDITDTETGLYSNPPLDSLYADIGTLGTLQLKYRILWNIYSARGEQKVLEAAAESSELIISLIDRIRASISEEESRIVLGDNYRESYLIAIRDFELCYRKTGDRRFLEKAFEFAEKSKVAGLLAATRQLKAIQFHIPQPLAEKEKILQREISSYNSYISGENEKEFPDQDLLAFYNERLLSSVAARDSLVATFERDYPGYYTLKYNTHVPGMKEIPSIIGKRYNYLNYVMSDSLLYIFLVNRKYGELFTFRTDSSLMRNLSDFRILLSDPSQGEAARTKFNKYQQIGHDLYKTLIQPVEKYLITDNLLVSPDNILSYLPFETFLSSQYSGKDILYRKLPYLMNDYDISYAYSATFIQESKTRNYTLGNRLIAFAPSYPASLSVDSLFNARQASDMIYDLPFARQEAEYVADITHGRLYLNNNASESVFKSEAGKYNIIHLAMHTIVNDQNPMNSAMIFTQVGDSADDGLLYTYEVYGIPLQTKMVVLSSCNTGSGVLSSGEGILSLARGFLYSGSKSVVMSLWKIEDRSGTEIIRLFYKNLEKGMSKSRALKRARYDYLRNASQLRSHPYFWSTLVVFGDNHPVFIPWKYLLCGLIITAFTAAGLLYYYRRRI